MSFITQPLEFYLHKKHEKVSAFLAEGKDACFVLSFYVKRVDPIKTVLLFMLFYTIWILSNYISSSI